MNRNRIIDRLRRSRLALVLIVAIAFAIGLALGGDRGDHGTARHDGDGAGAGGGEPTLWTCSMHPQIKLPEPGQCPICFMDLIPLETEPADEENPRVLTLSETARRLADIQSIPVERRFVDARIRMVGKVETDETRVKTITAWVPGRLERLFVDYTGIPVRQGDHLVELYSPDLISAQEELLQSLRAVEELAQSRLESVRESTRATVEAARDKLELLGLSKRQIAAIETRGEPLDRVTIYSPIGGIVVHKNATQGEYVQTGTPIYRIADLSVVWVKLDAYESDLIWLHYGQEVEFTTEALPGEVFRGRIAFIDPVLNPRTRTVKVRVNVPNPDLKLKPEMFVRAVVHARVARGGRTMDPDLAGKWIGPMHPEIVRDGPGTCPVCGMDLVPAEELGFVAADAPAEAPLVIPASAPLITGTRAVVYVEQPGERPTFEGREVVLGPRAGDFYLVEDGLDEGERVVVNGNFKIDSALQIQARPSMMGSDGEPADADAHRHGAGEPAATGGPVELPDAVIASLGALYDAYFAVQEALADDDLAAARAGFAAVEAAAGAVQHDALTPAAHATWMEEAAPIQAATDAGARAGEIAAARVAFRDLSTAVLDLQRGLGHGGEATYFSAWCPMAFDNAGASWLQQSKEIRNPYFGARMLRCGEIRETFAARDAK